MYFVVTTKAFTSLLILNIQVLITTLIVITKLSTLLDLFTQISHLFHKINTNYKTTIFVIGNVNFNFLKTDGEFYFILFSLKYKVFEIILYYYISLKEKFFLLALENFNSQLTATQHKTKAKKIRKCLIKYVAKVFI